MVRRLKTLIFNEFNVNLGSRYFCHNVALSTVPQGTTRNKLKKKLEHSTFQNRAIKYFLNCYCSLKKVRQ